MALSRAEREERGLNPEEVCGFVRLCVCECESKKDIIPPIAFVFEIIGRAAGKL